ncbi:MAG TPA: S-adenosylmethionine:tRNA ribosyltransferase-isomerase, partial [Oligoflexia bacterium]|nr:S-adenosylmethionine:tRNA ribosyltransferase-isomerase [Oligoflexia bacterium]
MASLEDFNFHLPEERIAREPARPRDHSKLLLCSARGRLGEFSGPIAYSERRFHEVLNELNSNDVLVLNNAKVLPVRLLGHRLNDDGTMGGQVEAVLSTPISDLEWNAILHLSARVRPGLKLRFEPGLIAEVLSTHEERLQNAGEVRLRLSGPGLAEQSLEAWLVRHGHVPLPTYMERSDSQQDRTDYQTVYAERIGSAAAPTAGMHFTQPLLDALAEKGVHIERLTLHVGIGTFRPIKATRIEDHQMH